MLEISGAKFGRQVIKLDVYQGAHSKSQLQSSPKLCMSDTFDFDGVDSSSAQVVGSPARRRSPARGRAVGYGRTSSKGTGRGGGGHSLGSPQSASGASAFAPSSPPRTSAKDNLDFGYDEGNATDNDDGDAGSIASSSVASSTLSFGTGNRTSIGRAGASGGGRSKMKKKQSASAKLQSRLQQMRKREAEEETERMVDDYASVGKRSVTSGGSGGVVGTGRRRKKAAAATSAINTTKAGRERKSGRKVTSAQQRRRQQQHDHKRPGSASMGKSTADDDTNDALLEDLLDDDTHMESKADGDHATGDDDDNGCNSRAGTPKAHGGSRSGTGSGSGRTRSTASGDRGFNGMMVDTSAKDEMEPCSQSSFLSLSASPYKRSSQHMSQDTDDNDDDASSTAFSHVSNASSARGSRKRVVIRRGRGAYGSHQQSQSSSIAGSGSAFGGDFDDIGSISTAGNSSVGSDAVLGGGVDVFAMQDAGTYRILSDDCSYLCETILSAIKSDGDDTSDPVIRHTSVTADACCDLAVLFSSARNRAVLLRTAKILQSDRSGSGPGSQPDEDSEVEIRRGRDALDSILEAISCAPFPPLSLVDGGDDSASAPAAALTKENGDAAVAAVGRTAKSRRGRAASAGNGKGKASINFGSSPPEHGELNPYDRVAARSLSVLAYYLSLECSKGDRSALRDTPAAAKRVRRRVLRNGPALRGVSRMVQLDPLVEAVLGSSTKSPGKIDGPDTSVETSNKTVGDVDTASVASSQSKRTNRVKRCREDGNDAEEKELTDIKRRATRDPTKAGRRKKRGKKRRLLLGKGSNENELETIPEDDGSRVSNEHAAELSPDAGAASGSSQRSPASVQASGGQSKQSKLFEKGANLEFLLSDDRSPDQGAAMADAGAKRNGAAASNPITAHDKNVERLNRKVLKAVSKLAKRTNLNDDVVVLGATLCSDTDCPCHRTSSDISSRGSGHLALGALSRLLTGKDKDGGAHGDGDDDGGGDGGDEDEHQSDDVDSDGAHSDGISNDENESNVDEENNLSNPLMFTNIMLRRSGSLPHLAHAVSDTFASIVCLIGESNGRKATSYCESSVNHLQKRASSLFSIIDGASCLSSENRKQFCQTKGGAALISNLLSLISAVPFTLEMSSAAISDIILSALRTLTSLTHENPLAAEQMLQSRKLRWTSSEVGAKLSVEAETSCLTGIGIILYNLHRMVTAQKEKTSDENVKGPSDESREKHCYDVVIFCLNILTNVVEMASFLGARRQIYESRLPNEGAGINGQSFSSSLAWLASWLTDQTTSYRDAVMKGSFGDEGLSLSHGAIEPRDLEKHEEEYLVTAGNGFILLAYLMKADDEVDAVGDELTMSIRETILSQMPTDEEGRDIGITLMIKTLKAFCNFYHFSIGPLSVAIVTPVLKLIKDLENIQSMKSKS